MSEAIAELWAATDRYMLAAMLLVGAILLALAVQVYRRRHQRPLHGAHGLVDVSEQHLLVVLVEAARADAVFRQEVLSLLKRPREERRRVIARTLVQMQRDGAAEPLVEAFRLLRDDVVVSRTRQLLAE